MFNLEELTLHLPVIRSDSTYINGDDLYDEILHYMPRLKRFLFNIHTRVVNNHVNIDLPSNDDIRNSFMKRGFQSVDAFTDYKLAKNSASCHVYSLPYSFSEFSFVGSCFRGGHFNQVRMLSMVDQRPFEYELFQIISQDFPLLEELTIINSEPQENREHHGQRALIFSHLFHLAIIFVHRDYMMQFLSERNALLPSLTHLKMDYKVLRAVTNNFTNDEELLNCTKVKVLSARNLPRNRPSKFDTYFSCPIRYLT
ncbi:unnamed protein product [Adineta ricciae]|nr:unnamed protein product [Adineta ricciae]